MSNKSLELGSCYLKKRKDSWVYRKPTHTGLILNFNAICTDSSQRGLILCLLNIAKHVLSSEDILI